METVLWVFFAFMFVGFLLFPYKSIRLVKAAFRHQLDKLPKPTPDKPAPPVKSLVEVHDEDHADWLEQYKAILQKDCDHLYHSQNWYTCYMCGLDEPWEYKEGCSCRVYSSLALNQPKIEYSLTQRLPSCKVHGKDYKLMPVSDRKQGPFGNNGGYGYSEKYNEESPYVRSKELIKYRNMRRLELPTREGTN